MQIKVHDVKKPEKGDKGRNRDVRNVCFIAVTVKIAAVFLRQGSLRMSQQRDLPESHGMACYRQSGNTTWCRGRFFGVARSVVARLWNRLQVVASTRGRSATRHYINWMTGIYS
ncbi:hypothetical protein TNCV_3467541 [Trichonephila clavipes]|nr:hypothetical protein TNCV_3467541 [Trichonephila clavipes]